MFFEQSYTELRVILERLKNHYPVDSAIQLSYFRPPISFVLSYAILSSMSRPASLMYSYLSYSEQLFIAKGKTGNLEVVCRSKVILLFISYAKFSKITSLAKYKRKHPFCRIRGRDFWVWLLNSTKQWYFESLLETNCVQCSATRSNIGRPQATVFEILALPIT